MMATSSTDLCFESHTYDWRPEYPLLVTAKRYWDPSSARQDGYTCVLAHGTGFHKEQWEPTIKYLFALSKEHHGFPIHEVWSVDCPNHGEAAILNEKILLRKESGYTEYFSWGEYVRSLHLFLTQNQHVQFADRSVIAIGHSMGAISLSLTLAYPNPPTFQQLVLCEPMTSPTDMPVSIRDQLMQAARSFEHVTMKRQDIWPSLDDAYKQLKSRKSFRAWDDEVLRIYLKYGFRNLPTGTYPNQSGVTLTCTKIQESVTYRDGQSSSKAYDFLPHLTAKLPVHVIWGSINDSIPGEIKRRVTDAKAGRSMASVSRVDGAGHLIVQMAPKGLATAIHSAVIQKGSYQSKL